MPVEFKLFDDKEMTKEIPYIGFPNKAVYMGTEGVIEGYIVNMDNNPFEVEEVKSEDENTEVSLENLMLNPMVAVKVTLKWRPPLTLDKTQWKANKGKLHFKGRYIVR